MKSILMKLLSAVTTLVLLVSPSFSATNINLGEGTFYDYSDFSATGRFTTIFNGVNDHETRIYAASAVEGYTPSGSSFIWLSKQTLNANGVTTKSVDIYGNVRTYSETGQIKTSVHNSADLGKSFAETISYNKDGSYTITSNESYDNKSTKTTVSEYDAANRIQNSVVTTKEDGVTSVATTAYKYDDLTRNVVSEMTTLSNGKGSSETTYEGGNRLKTVTTDVLTNSDGTTKNHTYTSATYDMDVNGKINSVTSFDETKNESEITKYDRFGRASTVYDTDNMKMPIGKYFYNDSTTPQSYKVTVETTDGTTKVANITVPAGGLKYKESYNLNNAGTAVFATTTAYFYDGNSNMVAGMGTK